MRLCYDPRSDTLELHIDLTPGQVATQSPSTRASVRAILDVADAGRLLGVELPVGRLPEPYRSLLQPLAPDGYLYLELDTPAQMSVALRSIPLTVTLDWDSHAASVRLSFPRRSKTHELLFPSGPT